jgi:aspartyl-tRNA(Asn)/glutamyl-tRNA(Gln) amidotransferase subunit B
MKETPETISKYVATIGLEIHAELKTASKMFCLCKNDPDEENPNVNICPICLGHPGTLPVLNKEAIKHVLTIGYAIGGTIADFTEWDRKNYFYPDIPKGYQISQYKYPLISGGELMGVKLTRIHLEEDTAQSTHDLHEKSLINFNRAGVPLMELVTEPVIHDAATAVNFAKELQLLLRYSGAGEANMEKGEMRVEANISIASEEDTKAGKFGTKTEVKNLNSFKVVEKAIAYEIVRQTKLLEQGQKVIQETRGWDEGTQKTYSQRAKESSHDYRYFPDPDIPKMKISEVAEFKKEALMKDIELPWTKRDRLQKEFGMTDKEVAVFVENPEVARYFEAVIKGNTAISKLAMNYILTDYLGLLKKDSLDIESSINKISSENFAELIMITKEGKINSRGTKDILALLYKGESGPERLAETHGLIQKSDEGELKKIVEELVKANPNVVEDFKKGKQAALMFFVGQGMKATKGSANPEVLKKIILEVIG